MVKIKELESEVGEINAEIRERREKIHKAMKQTVPLDQLSTTLFS